MRGLATARLCSPLIPILMVLVSCGAPPATAQSESNGAGSNRSAGAATRHALLIGINEYRVNELPSAQREGPRFPDLNGAVNDIDLIQRVLRERYELAPERIVRLIDAAATRANILKELADLADRTAAGDAIYIHFSGHGSQVRDFDGDEADGFDETILPHDARTGEVRDITDDELGQAMDRLRGRNVLLVLDSCHSGTATRGATVLSRYAAPDPREQLYRAAGAERPKTREVVEADLHYTLMTGAGEQESALDGPIGGRYFGFFSYLLAGALERVPTDASARAVHEEVLTGYARFGRRLRQIAMPIPQLEAPADRIDRSILALREVQPAAAGARLAFATVLASVVAPAPGGGEPALILQAAGFEAEPGLLWAIYPPGELEFRSGEALAIAESTGVSGSTTTARVLRPLNFRAAEGARAIPLSSTDSERTRVGFDRVPPKILAAIRTHLKTIPRVEEAAEGELAQFVVVGEADRIEIRGVGGLATISSISSARAEAAARHVARVVRHAGAVADLLALENRASALELDVELLADSRDSRPREATDSTSYSVREDGQPRTQANSLSVEIVPGADGFLTIVDVDTEGQVQLLFPNEASEERGFLPGGAVVGGTSVRLPDSLDSDNRAGFYWDVAPPAGLDTLQIFLSTDRATADRIREFVAQMNADGGSSADELARNLATRGIRIVRQERTTEAPAVPQPAPTSPGDWTSRSISFVVRGDTP